MPVPALGAGMVMEHQEGTGGRGLPIGFVTFRDRGGRMRSVNYEVLDEAARAHFAEDLARGSSVVQTNLGQYVREAIPADLYMNGEEGRLLHERPVTLADGGPAYLGILEIRPSGMATAASETRGFLVTIHAGVNLVLAAADPRPGATPDQTWDHMAAVLEDLYRSLVFP